MPERCDWCDKFPLLRISVVRVEGDLICRECWPEEWGEWPHDRRAREEGAA